MKSIEIIPVIDICDGRCVRLYQGDLSKTMVYNNSPLETAKIFEQQGFKRLHMVDLDGAKAGRVVNHKILEEISKATKLVIDFGGGIKSNEDIKIAFDSGAAMITVGSIAVKNRPLFINWIEKYGRNKIILAADVRNEKIAVSGWAESTEIEVIPFIRGYFGHGIRQYMCTDITKDGMLGGSSINLYRKLMDDMPDMELIASGGVKSIEDIKQLKAAGLSGVIVGRALYEGKINIDDLSKI